MGVFVLTAARFLYHSVDLGAQSSQFRLQSAVELQDVTTFGSTARKRIPGLLVPTLDYRGFWDLGTNLDSVLDAAISSSTARPLSVSPTDTVGDRAFLTEVLKATMRRGGSVGEAAQLEGTFEPIARNLLKGYIAATGTKTSTANGAGINAGAVTASQFLYAALHVPPTVSGTLPTLDVTIQSDSDDTWASPTTRITFTQKTAEGSQFATPVAGAITDTWWRAVWTIGGTGAPTFPIFVVFAIA